MHSITLCSDCCWKGNRFERPIKPRGSNGSKETLRSFHRQQIGGNNFSPFLSTGCAAAGGTGGSKAEPGLEHRRRHSQAVAQPGRRQLWESSQQPLKLTFLHTAASCADRVGVGPEVGSAGCLPAGKARGEKMRAESDGSLSMRKQMCVLALQTHFSLRCLGRPSAQGWKRRHFCCKSPLV